MPRMNRTDSTKKKRKPKSPKKKDTGIVLPTELEVPVDDLNRYSVLIHGEKKIGKTTLALQGGRVLLLQNDPPQLAYERMEIVTSSWEIFRKALKELERAAKKTKFPYDRIVIDGADTWFKRCQHWVCDQRGIQHPEDEGWGRGWDALRQEFEGAVTRLLCLPCGVWFLCHSVWKEIETRKRMKEEKLVPKLTSMGEEILNGKVDAWFAYDYDGNRRVLFIQGDERTGAGHRLDVAEYPHFRGKDGKPLKYIRMGKSPKIAYDRFVKAFHNQYSHPSKKKK